jgi:hypothetical protein
MCDMSGDYESLAKAAKKAYQAKQLIDVDDEEGGGPKGDAEGNEASEGQSHRS